MVDATRGDKVLAKIGMRKHFGLDITFALAFTHDDTRLEVYVDGAEPDHAMNFTDWSEWNDTIEIKILEDLEKGGYYPEDIRSCSKVWGCLGVPIDLYRAREERNARRQTDNK